MKQKSILPELYFETRAEWRRWLAKNHRKTTAGIWLVFYKQATGKPSLEYKDALDEALCFGWIDSLIRKLDVERFARKFTPRQPTSNWSLINKQRVAVLIEQGVMTEHGQALIDFAKANGRWDTETVKPRVATNSSAEFSAALQRSPLAARFFSQLTAVQQRHYIGWINQAKRSETRARRIKEAIALLKTKKPLGLK